VLLELRDDRRPFRLLLLFLPIQSGNDAAAVSQPLQVRVGTIRSFLRKVAQLSRNSRAVARGQLATLACMIGVLLLRLTVAPWLLAVHVAPTVPLKHMLVFSVGLFALLFGAWKLHQSKMATRELTWQYTNQLGHFSRINGEFEETDAPLRRADLLIELGKRSLIESYLWTIHRYHREHAPPAGGS